VCPRGVVPARFSSFCFRTAVPHTASNKIVIICGPTGVGKTGFAISLAQKVGGEIVGADSMQIYRGMDIGTAKPTAAEQAAVVHHMVDVVDPGEEFDAAEYGRRAEKCVTALISKGRMPFVVGGTGLYIKALVYGLAEAAASDSQVHDRLTAELERSGSRSMHQRLAQVDSQSAQRIHPNDTFRILRALEVYHLTGRPLTAHHADHGFARARFDTLRIGLTLPRPELYARIDRRVDAMLAQGLVAEVRALLAKGFDPRLKSMQSLGYRHMTDYLQGRLEWDEAVRTLKRDHRRYAKRQMTWFGADSLVRWLRPDQFPEAVALVEDFLTGNRPPRQISYSD
jgi:tRNA dimethylallyltransferase